MLILAFVAIGAVVYQATAPDRPATGTGFSLTGAVNNLRAHLRAERVTANVRREAAQPVDAGITRLVITGLRGKLAVVGSEKGEATAVLTADVFGADEADAQRAAGEVSLSFREAGESLEVQVSLPQSRRRPTTDLRVEVPRRLAVRVEGRGQVQIREVADVSLDTRTGAIGVRDITGILSGEHRDGEVSATATRGVRLTTRRSTVRLEDIRGSVDGDLTDGRILLRGVTGTVVLETRRSDVDIDRALGETRLTSTDGRVTLREPRGAVTFVGERCRLTLLSSAAVPVSASSTDADVDLQLPGAGITLDAAADDGRVELPEAVGLSVTTGNDGARHASAGPVAGGGPLWRVRTTRGDVVLRR